ncbi:hypothetical protein FRC18_000788 [Serendipita sp. 400]|nr:hypothetical protein FRC18_000788 [Serendipita sp. 400]
MATTAILATSASSSASPFTLDFVTRGCADVPIDLDDADMHSDVGEFEDVPLEDAQSPQLQRHRPRHRRQDSDDSVRNLGLESSTWSSSSGSFYDDLETSPIGVGSTWYWHSPSHEPEDKPNWIRASPSANIHHPSGTGYLSRSKEGKDDKMAPTHGEQPLQKQSTTSKVTKIITTTTSSKPSPSSRLCVREIAPRDLSDPRQVMTKTVQSNREIELLQYLNTPSSRYDPWNPSPPLISIVNADECDKVSNTIAASNNGDSDSDTASEEGEALAVFETMIPFDDSPIGTVGEGFDFFMQLLQGLIFLQENNVVHGDINASVVMMDEGNKYEEEEGQWNRIRSNVRYYLADFTHGAIVEDKTNHLFLEDLRDLGLLIDQVLGRCMPELSNIILEMTTLRKANGVCSTSASQVLQSLEELIEELSPERIRQSLL